MKGRIIPYSADELAWIEARKDWVISDLHRAFCDAFGRDDVAAGSLHALRKRKGWKTGRTGRFAKGQTPPNKGKKMPWNANSAATQFKKGERRGVAIKLYKPIGTERLSKEGYLERKIHDGMPLQSRWRAVHLIRWEERNGAIPDGMCLKCLGDRENTDPSNWELIPRALLPRLAGGNQYVDYVNYDTAAPELKPVILAVAKLDHIARAARMNIARSVAPVSPGAE